MEDLLRLDLSSTLVLETYATFLHKLVTCAKENKSLHLETV